jgi:hypothetical protein
MADGSLRRRLVKPVEDGNRRPKKLVAAAMLGGSVLKEMLGKNA